MSFIERAQKLRARGEDARALLVLVEGLKRHPDSAEGIDVLLRWYALEIPTPGIEPDVVSCLLLQPDGDDLLSTIVDNLRASGSEDLAEAVLDAGEHRGLKYVPPAPEAIQSREEAEHDLPVLPSNSADSTVEATIATAQLPDEAEVDVVAIPVATAKTDAPNAPVRGPAPTTTTKVQKPPPSAQRKRWLVGTVLNLPRGRRRLLLARKGPSVGSDLLARHPYLVVDPIHLSHALNMARDAADAWPNEPEILERKAFSRLSSRTRAISLRTQ
ncbi:MAG: hypothetical protein R3E66_21770 [bacterium]